MIPIEVAAKQFLLACRAEGLSAKTIQWYRHLLNSLTAQFYGQSLESIDANTVRQYLADLRDRKSRYVKARNRPEIEGGLSHESLRDHMRAMRRFFNWCTAEYQLDPARNPMLRIRMPGRDHSEPKAISLEDLRALLVATDDSQFGIRDRAMIAFLADTGCRAAGLLTLTRSNTHLAEGYALVHEKGRRDRRVPFTPYTSALLQDWIRVRPPEAENDIFFCSLATNTFGQQLTLSGLHSMLKRLKKRSGVTGRINPHSFRHGFARQYLLNGGDLATLAQLMGHSDVSVTVGYYAVYKDAELARLHERFSPMRNIRK